MLDKEQPYKGAPFLIGSIQKHKLLTFLIKLVHRQLLITYGTWYSMKFNKYSFVIQWKGWWISDFPKCVISILPVLWITKYIHFQTVHNFSDTYTHKVHAKKFIFIKFSLCADNLCIIKNFTLHTYLYRELIIGLYF